MSGVVEEKIPDASNFINTHNFNKSTKVNFNAKMAEAPKDIAIKNQVETALDLGDGNRNKITGFKTFDLSFLLVNNFCNDGFFKIIMFVNPFINHWHYKK